MTLIDNGRRVDGVRTKMRSVYRERYSSNCGIGGLGTTYTIPFGAILPLSGTILGVMNTESTMETKTLALCTLAIFLSIIDFAASVDDHIASELSHEHMAIKRMAPQIGEDEYLPSINDLTDDELDELANRASSAKLGKRGSILRFGKRGVLLRFGKRRSILRYGKRFDDSDELSEDPLSWQDKSEESNRDYNKRGSLFRFGKRGAILRYGRSADKPHTPFRFGREDYRLFSA